MSDTGKAVATVKNWTHDWTGFSLRDVLKDVERKYIADALKDSDGAVTSAATLLGLTHQGLCYLINERHPELLTKRRPVRVRRKALISKTVSRRKYFREVRP